MQITLLSLQVGRPQRTNDAGVPDPNGTYTTAFRKLPVAGPVFLSKVNLAGDAQADLKNHGGPDKAVNIYVSEHYPFWREALGLTEMPFGAFGENFTLSGAREEDVCIGDVFDVGDARVQISQPRIPCWKMARRWQREDLAAEAQRLGLTGWYFRVLREGSVETGQALRLVERPIPEWTVARANEVMHHRPDDIPAAEALSACPLLAEAWRRILRKRVEASRSAG